MKFSITQVGGRKTIRLIGNIDESFEASIDELGRAMSERPTIVDFDKVNAANSIGISHWLELCKRYPDAEMRFTNCHESIMHTAVMVESFFPNNSVESARFDFRCHKCDHKQTVNFTPTEDQPFPTTFGCSKCSEEIAYEDGDEFDFLFVIASSNSQPRSKNNE